VSWQDRLQKAAYISPLGFRRVFHYEDVNISFIKKTADFEFPAKDGSYVQDLGRAGRRIPLRVVLWGDDYDKEALAFEATLLEKGVGRLEHPIYGTINVIPFGDIKRRDDLKTSANQAIIEVEFYETIFELYAGALTDILDDIFKLVDLYNDASSGQLDAEVIVDTVVQDAYFRNFYGELIGGITGSLGGIANSDEAVRTQFNATSQSMTQDLESTADIDTKILGSQTNILIQLPAKVSTINIDARYGAYLSLFQGVLDYTADNIQIEQITNKEINEFFSRDMHAGSYLAGIIVAILNTRFELKSEVLTYLDNINELFTQWTDWREANYALLGSEDVGEMYGTLQQTVALTSSFLVQESFDLKTEKTIILDRDRALLELVAELYQDIDNDTIDLFIKTNSLSGDEILELPRGRQVVYYV